MLEEEIEKLIAVFCEKEDLLPKSDRKLVEFIMKIRSITESYHRESVESGLR